jgi:hypothetical protein
VFFLAGVTKLIDRHGSYKAIVAFGLPLPLARPITRLLPLCELFVGFALIVDPTAWWGAIGD